MNINNWQNFRSSYTKSFNGNVNKASTKAETTKSSSAKSSSTQSSKSSGGWSGSLDKFSKYSEQRKSLEQEALSYQAEIKSTKAALNSPLKKSSINLSY